MIGQFWTEDEQTLSIFMLSSLVQPWESGM